MRVLSTVVSDGTARMVNETEYLTYAVVNLDAIAHNVRALKAHVGAGVEVMAVVKANAYGHGALPVARTALENGATRLAVARASEGVALRAAGIDAPTLILGYSPPGEAEAIVANDLTATANTLTFAAALDREAGRQGRTVPVHVKVDTGMGRFGLLPHEAPPFVQELSRFAHLRLEGLGTHFAVADLPDKSYTWQQFDAFCRVLGDLEAAGVRIPLRHVANSAATLDLPEMHLDAVRPGIALYGLRPNPDVEPPIELLPALSLYTHVERVRMLPPGSSISYGRTFVCERDTPVVLIAAGYGDGYPRLLSNRASVLIRGQRAPVVGRVCMDHTVVDVTGVDGVAQDDLVVLLGEQGGERITAEELAQHAETINYEITTGLLPRIRRIYTRGGQIVAG